MASQSPQRARKAQLLSGSQGTTPPREMSPSPTFRDRQRTIKATSMPIVPSVSQIYGTSANTIPTQRQGQQPSPTMMNISHQKRPSSPLAQGSIVAGKLPSPSQPPSSMIDEMLMERDTPPPTQHALNQSNILQHMVPPPPPQHSQSQPNIHSLPATNPSIGYPRPMNRLPPPPFLNNFHTIDESWQMTDELMAEIERADLAQSMTQHAGAPGTSGVAYAGGASSGAVYVRETSSPAKEPVDRMRANERMSPKETDGHGSGGSAGRRPARLDRDVQPVSENIRPRDRPLPASPAGSPQSQGQLPASGHTPERGSPQYLTAVGSSGEQSAAYNPYKRDSYQSAVPSQARPPTPPSLRRASNASSSNPESVRHTPPATAKYISQTPPLQAMKTRTPDKSLPVQEEPEDDIAIASKNGMNWVGRDEYGRPHEMDRSTTSPKPEVSRNGHTQQYSQGGRDGRGPAREEDDDETLIDNDSEDVVGHDRGRDTEEESYTPRSPTANLPEDIQAKQYTQQQVSAHARIPIIPKHRNGSTDQLGLRSFDPAVFMPPQAAPRPKEESLNQRSQQFHQYINHFSEQEKNGRFPQDDAHSVADSTSAYIQSYIQSPRPNAPIPPTPHSQTAAPSPLISDIRPSPAPPAGSPYPYPFSHVRRANTYSGYPVQPSATSSYDPNHPSAIQEQLALQMHMYAINNNHAAMSDSTFSPSSTPFPGAGYNPWAILQASRVFGRNGDSMSMQSSPSHEPVPLPYHSNKGLKRRERSSNLRYVSAPRKVRPPPRVESTQPRETSPEPYSSGEETAGEEKDDVDENGNWVDDRDDGNGEWVDEDEDDKDDLLDLEYHPDYINSIDKRRRRWDSRWDALVQAFQALDRETDTSLVLLAAPSHSTKLHALTSRSIRREVATQHSVAMTDMRASFRNIATRRRASRSQGTSSLVERLLMNSNISGDGSDVSSESREGDLKRALETALGSLGALRGIYEQRVARWEDEMSRISDERERVEMLLKQTLGINLQNGVDPRHI